MWKLNDRNINSKQDLPENTVGFVYMIIDSNGKKYIGKKSILSTTNPIVSKSVYDKAKADGFKVSKTRDKKLSKKGAPVWKYKREVVKETNWLNYTGSCKPLNTAIKKGLKITKHIIHVCNNKKQLTYFETKEQICQGVIENNDEFWNSNVMARFFPDDFNKK